MSERVDLDELERLYNGPDADEWFEKMFDAAPWLIKAVRERERYREMHAKAHAKNLEAAVLISEIEKERDELRAEVERLKADLLQAQVDIDR